MDYDLIIIGAGPAGLTASTYASRYKINHLLIGQIPGGLIAEAHKVCNWPGEKEISGAELASRMQDQAQAAGGQMMPLEKIVSVKKNDEHFFLETESQKKLTAKNILLAIGTKHRKLNLAEENKYLGRGLAYCATCDAMFYRDKIVGVLGGGNSALTAALYLAEIAAKVYIIERSDQFRGELVWIDRVLNNEKIEVVFNNSVIGLTGQDKLSQVILQNDYDHKRELDLNGLFVEIGTEPDDLLIKQLDLKTSEGYIVVDHEQKTSLAGVWAAGDITTNSAGFRQAITACSEGAIAAFSIFSEWQKSKK